MTDETKMSRRGFLGIVGAIGVAPFVVTRAEPGGVPTVELLDEMPERSPGLTAHGTQLKYRTVHGQDLPLGELIEISGHVPDPKVDSWMGRVTGLVDAGRIDVTMIENDMITAVQSPAGWVGNPEPTTFQIIFNEERHGNAVERVDDPSYWEFKAYVVGYLVSSSLDVPVESTLELQIVGEPHFYPKVR